jgi:hypothetical protein
MRLGSCCAAVLLAALAALAGTGDARANVVANWDKSARSWNNAHFTKIKAAMEAAGHRVDADASINQFTLGAAVIVIGEPVATPSADELAALQAFVRRGGILLIFGDTGIDLPTYNNLLAGIGSTIQFTTTTIGTTSALPDGVFTAKPTSIVGSSLTVTSGNGTAGGTLIDSNYGRYESIGSGYVVVFGDRIDHNDVISATNTALLVNIVSAAIAEAPIVPTLSAALLPALALVVAAAAGLDLSRRRHPRPASKPPPAPPAGRPDAPPSAPTSARRGRRP